MFKKIFVFGHWSIMNLKSIFSVFTLNILIMLNRIRGKKVIFFYHPRKLLTSIQTIIFEDLFEDYNKNFVIIYGHISENKLGKKYYFIKEGFVRFLINVNIFMSCYVCDKFTNKSERIYIDHVCHLLLLQIDQISCYEMCLFYLDHT